MKKRMMIALAASVLLTVNTPAALAAQTTAEPELVTESCLTNGKPVTEENVLELLRQIQQDWPANTIWGTSKTPGTHKNEVPSSETGRVMQSYRVSNTYGCGAYASMVSSLIFGDTANPARRLEDLSQIRPGDILVYVRNDNGKVSPTGVRPAYTLTSTTPAKCFWTALAWAFRCTPWAGLQRRTR